MHKHLLSNIGSNPWEFLYYFGLKVINTLKLSCIFLILLLFSKFSFNSEVYLGQFFALNKLILGSTEHKGANILNKSGVAN